MTDPLIPEMRPEPDTWEQATHGPPGQTDGQRLSGGRDSESPPDAGASAWLPSESSIDAVPQAGVSPIARPRGPRMLLLLLVGAVVLAVAAGILVGRNFLSPAQQAAGAAPPPPSLITVRVRLGRLVASVVVRANVRTSDPVTVHLPTDLGSDLPVVTSVNIRRGEQVEDGQELLTIAERPVFAFTGTIPAFRDIRPGTVGVDVAELQAGLHERGYPTGADKSGVYGPGTSAAVQAFYTSAGAAPSWTSPGAQAELARLQAAVRNAPAGPVRSKAVRTLEASERTTGVVVPLGEVVFIPRLPQRLVLLSVHPGSAAKPSVPLAKIGSGRVTITGRIGQAQKSQLRVGMMARAVSDVSGASFPVRVRAIVASSRAPTSGAATYRISFAPTRSLPAGIIGQNVAVTTETDSSAPRVLIVPVASISTDASGRAYVTVVSGRGRQRDVTVRLGLESGGEQAVTPVGEQLRPGEAVVVGSTASGSV